MSIWAETTPNGQLFYKKMILRGGPKSFFYMIACLKSIKTSSTIVSKWLWGSGGLESIEFDKISYKKMVCEEVGNHFFIRYLWKSVEFQEFEGIHRNFKEFIGIERNVKELNGISRNFKEFEGIYRNLKELKGM